MADNNNAMMTARIMQTTDKPNRSLSGKPKVTDVTAQNMGPTMAQLTKPVRLQPVPMVSTAQKMQTPASPKALSEKPQPSEYPGGWKSDDPDPTINF